MGTGAVKDKKNAMEGAPVQPSKSWWLNCAPTHIQSPSVQGGGVPAPHTSGLKKVSRPAALRGGFIAKSESSVSVSYSTLQSLPRLLCAHQWIIINPEQAVWQGLCLHLGWTYTQWHKAIQHNWSLVSASNYSGCWRWCRRESLPKHLMNLLQKEKNLFPHLYFQTHIIKWHFPT